MRRPQPALVALAWYGAGSAPLALSPADTPLTGWPAPRAPTGRFALVSGPFVQGAPQTFFLMVPVRGAGGRVEGVLVGQVLANAFASRIPMPRIERGRPVLLDAGGRVLFAAGAPDLPIEARDWSQLPGVAQARRGEPIAVARIDVPGEPAPALAGFAPVGGTGWVAGVTRPRAEALAAGRAGLTAPIVVSATALLVGLAGAFLFARRLARPVERLAAAARSGGEASSAVPPDAPEEYVHLARAVAATVREARRRTAETELIRRHLQALLAALADPAVITDAEGRLAVANPAAEQILGHAADGGVAPYPVLDLAGRPLAADDLPAAQAAATGRRVSMVLQVGPPGGDRRVLSADATPVVDDTGRLSGVVTVYRDLTERRETERRLGEVSAELRSRTELVEALFARLPAALALVQGPDLRLRAANSRFFQLAGVTEGPLAGRKLADFFPAAVAAQVAGWIAAVRETGTAGRGVDVRIDGARRDAAYWTYAAVPLKDGTRDTVLLAITDTSEDVAARVKAQRAIDRVEQKGAELDAVLKTLADGVVLLDDTGRIAAMNRAAEQILGRPSEKGVRPRLEDYPRLSRLFDPAGGGVIPPDALPWRLALAGEPVDRREAYLVTEALEKRFLALSAAPLRTRRGRLIGAAVSFRDITREKEVESFKLQFIARAAHELRTPLTTIKGNLLLALKGRFGALAPAQQEALRVATRSVDSMVSLIDDLLDLTRFETGRLRLFGEEVALESIVDRALAQPRLLAAAKGVSVEIHPSVAGIVGYWDAAKVEQVLANVFSNAVKFTPSGGRVEIRAYPEAHLVTLAVKDTGIGIPRDKLALVFQPFVSLHRQDQKAPRQRGTGLGLSIAQSIVEAHGGRMWAESEGLGRGTTIYLTLPLDHRRAERVRLDRPARVLAGSTPIEPSTVADLSADGAAIVAPNDLLSARELTVEIEMPGGAVRAVGEVVRVEPVEGSTRCKAGIRFREMPDAARAVIVDWVRRMRSERAAG
ncbi:MAG TPA: PAS domain-containing protein [Thermodesulfobacteriota bacterium]